MNHRADVSIIGSGFAGSILAWILASQGLRVALIDAAKHPHFAIGESSTPIADLLLRRLGQQYDLPELVTLSTWGGWQQCHPQISCGRKRGFSYYRHTHGQPFRESTRGDNSLLVTASESDQVADTHWFRAEVDQFFFRRAIESGAIDLTGHSVVAHEVVDDSTYALTCLRDESDSGSAPEGEHRVEIRSEWVIDASGQASVLASLSGAVDHAEQLRTRTHTVYGHYAGVTSWTEYLMRCGIGSEDDPFDPDDAAQHHLLGGGWLWMLRFNNDLTSVGYTAPLRQQLDWSGYPSIEQIMRDATCVAPRDGPRRSKRLQRLYDPVIGPRRMLLPTAATTLDPLHSTGIAHALAGVDRLAAIVTQPHAALRSEMIQAYGRSVLEETRLLDQLVSTAYATINDFPRFTTACMLYFAGAICCEERYQLGDTPTHLFNADDRGFVAFVKWACELLEDRSSHCIEKIRQRIEPWNTAGLMNPAAAGRYAYTATKRD